MSVRPGAEELQGLEVEVEPPDDRVAQPLPAAAVELDVVGGPAPAEQLGLGGQLADQLDEGLVVRVAAGLEAEHRGGVVGDPLVVDEEILGRLRVQVDEPRGVGGPPRVRQHGGVQRPGQLVHRQDVVPAVAHPRRRVGHRVQHLLDRRADGGRGGALPAGAAVTALPGQREQMGPLGLVEPERPRHGLEHALGGAGEAAALHPDVVVDRDAGEHRDLLAPQPLHPAIAAVRRQTRLLRRDPRPPGAQELADLGAQVEGADPSTVGTRPRVREALAVPGTTGSPSLAAGRVDWTP